MPWLQLRVQSSRDDAQIVEQALLDNGACSVTLQDNADQPILEPALGETPLWEDTLITGLFEADIDTTAISAAIELQIAPLTPASRWEQLEDKDWEREWMSNFKPIHCGGELWICPSWCEPPNPQAVNLLLDPGLAFGTGTHPTTWLCLNWLSQQQLDGKTIVDFGCGSGILGIAALLLGADRFVGTDIDPQALIATRDNALRNGLQPQHCPVYLPGDCPKTEADVVMANILAGPLVELAETLASLTKSGGRLCLSGVLTSQSREIIERYEQWFDFDPVSEKDEWISLSAIKRIINA